MTSRQLEKDGYGFVVGSKTSLFCKAICKKPCTMSDIKKMDWNDKKATFYNVFNELRKKGITDRDAEGRMFMKN